MTRNTSIFEDENAPIDKILFLNRIRNIDKIVDENFFRYVIPEDISLFRKAFEYEMGIMKFKIDAPKLIEKSI